MYSLKAMPSTTYFNKSQSGTNHMKTITLELPADCDLYDLTGNLSTMGKSRFCRELNHQIRLLDVQGEDNAEGNLVGTTEKNSIIGRTA